MSWVVFRTFLDLTKLWTSSNFKIFFFLIAYEKDLFDEIKQKLKFLFCRWILCGYKQTYVLYGYSPYIFEKLRWLRKHFFFKVEAVSYHSNLYNSPVKSVWVTEPLLSFCISILS